MDCIPVRFSVITQNWFYVLDHSTGLIGQFCKGFLILLSEEIEATESWQRLQTETNTKHDSVQYRRSVLWSSKTRLECHVLLYLDDNSFLRNFPNYSILQSQSWNPHTFVERIAGASKEFVDPLIRIRLLVYRCLMNSYRHMPRLLVFWISPCGPQTIYYTIDGQPLLGNPDNLYLNMRYRIKGTR